MHVYDELSLTLTPSIAHLMFTMLPASFWPKQSINQNRNLRSINTIILARTRTWTAYPDKYILVGLETTGYSYQLWKMLNSGQFQEIIEVLLLNSYHNSKLWRDHIYMDHHIILINTPLFIDTNLVNKKCLRCLYEGIHPDVICWGMVDHAHMHMNMRRCAWAQVISTLHIQVYICKPV